jgi:hypothetical protein
VPTFADRGVSRGQRGGSPTVVNLSFLDRPFTLQLYVTAYYTCLNKQWNYYIIICNNKLLKTDSLILYHTIACILLLVNCKPFNDVMLKCWNWDSSESVVLGCALQRQVATTGMSKRFSSRKKNVSFGTWRSEALVRRAGVSEELIVWRRHVPPKCRLFLLEPHCVTSHKTTSFIVTAVKNIPEDRGLRSYTDFTLFHRARIGFGSQATSKPMLKGGSSPEGKVARAWKWSSAEVKMIEYAFTPFASSQCHDA